LIAWRVAAPLGVLLRALVLGRDSIPVTFLIVVLGVGGAFVLGWRLAYLAVRGWLARRSRAA
jgi:hypothetical protein